VHRRNSTIQRTPKTASRLSKQHILFVSARYTNRRILPERISDISGVSKITIYCGETMLRQICHDRQYENRGYALHIGMGLMESRTPYTKKKTKLRGLSPRANYTDRATAACRRSYCQLLRVEGATWSA
jgi:hypothetical protein